MASWEVTGFLGGLDKIGKMISSEKAAAAEDIAQYVLGEAVKEVPHEDGDLQASGKVSVDESAGVAAVSFDTPYAVRQHEDMTYKHDEGRKAKYLEDPFNAASQGPAQALIARRLKMGS